VWTAQAFVLARLSCSRVFSISLIFAVSACMATVASWQALTKALLAWNMRVSASEKLLLTGLRITRAEDEWLSDKLLSKSCGSYY
jgi:hypothetical protein